MLFFSTLRRSLLWLLFCCVEMMWTCWGISVSFPYKQPVYVAPDRILILQAQLTLGPGESVRLLTWDLRRGGGEKRLATVNYPDVKNIQYKINNVTTDQTGTYVLTITDGSGEQKPALVDVRISQKPPQASLSMQCIVVPERPLWDSPVFSWWVNGNEVTNQTANLSADGSTLYLTSSLGSNYTCAFDSSQGSSSVQSVRDPKPDTSSCSNAGTIIAVIEAIVIVGLLLKLCWPRIKKMLPRKPDGSAESSEKL
ncbi:uncharacterized protein [Salminus brasiliensis]|uniref:uncharacterized protein n=1 Tax=Salminus brasiliensis TaxID=930266 RepID=UPI003B82E81D